MNRLFNKALSALFVCGFIIVMGAFTVLAESGDNMGVHIPEVEIGICLPMIEINVDVQDFALIQTSHMSHKHCKDVLAAHQERIDNIIALICGYDIDCLHDLSAFLRTLQSNGDYICIIPFICSGGCDFIPVWVMINGVRHPGRLCANCNRIFI
ncbi:MAG: hypothetical protein FWF81_07830 [Defluviitaleaceae bacterium]|nr:hypothetical protein [Defluviitaleaceae bacterium]